MGSNLHAIDFDKCGESGIQQVPLKKLLKTQWTVFPPNSEASAGEFTSKVSLSLSLSLYLLPPSLLVVYGLILRACGWGCSVRDEAVAAGTRGAPRRDE